jgi:hypothetical protein
MDSTPKRLEASRNHPDQTSQLRERLCTSKAQLDRGEGVILDEAGLASFFPALQDRAISPHTDSTKSSS